MFFSEWRRPVRRSVWQRRRMSSGGFGQGGMGMGMPGMMFGGMGGPMGSMQGFGGGRDGGRDARNTQSHANRPCTSTGSKAASLARRGVVESSESKERYSRNRWRPGAPITHKPI